ncbi:pyridoxal phosphate-dependent decarboxylase family protein [Nitratidesulfovibrio sp. SRB-5]|uniref:pyridoxal phosphate-dependent decarboxylase family protein n=1 Tax=Nitratidesulfovibrio sp. SRB-5 TaxID=2872636 RepID=UPI00102727C6|nr:pyridoxal-dependent decarboxylase [Nitratidesulfovibrio sp. SRB-5]MBZ2171090.1 amino acid decarboxylase [Nitratidesulfovibrio sp. SRB-5]RXF77981.1 amino acid decarboxylase [Desulfovibrio sp. DS-1]
MQRHETLDLEDFEALLHRAATMIADRVERIGPCAQGPVVHPATFDELAALIPSDWPEAGAGAHAVLDDVARCIEPYATRIGHPRFLAWITTSPAPAGTLGDIVCTGLNQAPLSFKGGPAATVLEHVVLGWLARLFGLPQAADEGMDGAGGTIVSGGTMANLMGLTVARHTHFPEAATRGLAGIGRIPVLYVSDQGHMSIERSAVLLGLGADNVRAIPSGADNRMDVAALRAAITMDREAGLAPFCVVAQAGSVTTGAVDPLPEIADTCADEGLWFHVDAAYGGAAMLTDEGRALLAGIHRADSICVDPHKWFFIPLECGVTLFRSKAQQLATFRARASYLGEENPHDLKNTTFILSRANRALKVWFAFRTYGRERLRRIVTRNMELARHFRDLCAASPEWRVLAPVQLSIACARYVPQGGGWTEEDVDRLQVRLLERLEASGEGFLTPAMVRGRAGVRLCVANHRTSEADIRLLFDLMTTLGRELVAQGPQGPHASQPPQAPQTTQTPQV